MTTQDLIARLAVDVRPVSRHALDLRLGGGALSGALIALALLFFLLGIRPDAAAASATAPFWIKAVYAASYGFIGYLLARQLAAPEIGTPGDVWIAAIPAGLLMIDVGRELSAFDGNMFEALFVRKSWKAVAIILGLALPVYASVMIAHSRLAPTNLRAAGAAAGLAASGIAATIYSFHCQEISPTFLFTRYTAAMVLMAAAGALTGPRLLRW